MCGMGKKKDGPNPKDNKKLDKTLRSQGVDPDQAYCTECNNWYNTKNQAEVNKHAH
jgi:hypothetical protein